MRIFGFTITRHPSVADVDPIELFERDVDLAVQLFGLDPQLAEVTSLKQRAPSILAVRGLRRHYLRLLNPRPEVTERDDGSITVGELTDGHVLEPWTRARHHVYRLDQRLARLVVNAAGTHLYGKNDRLLVSFPYAHIGRRPHHNAVKRFEQVSDLVLMFTGVMLDKQKFVTLLANQIVLTPGPDGWELHTSPAMAYH